MDELEKQENNEPKKTINKKKKIVIYVLVGLFFIGLIFSFIFGNTNSENNNTNNDKPTITESENTNRFNKINDIVNKNDVLFRITKVENTKNLTNGYHDITSDTNFAVVYITIKNNSKSTYSANPYNFNINKYGADGKLISSSEYSSETYMMANGLTATDINYGVTKSFVIVYELDNETTSGDYRLEINDGLFSSSLEIMLR